MKLLLTLAFCIFFLIGCKGDSGNAGTGGTTGADTGTSTPSSTTDPSKPAEETTYLIDVGSGVFTYTTYTDSYVYITNNKGKEYKLTYGEMLSKRLQYCLKVKGSHFSSLSIKVQRGDEPELTICDNCPKANYSIDEYLTAYHPVRNITNKWFSSTGSTHEVIFVPFTPSTPSVFKDCAYNSCIYLYIVGKRGTNLGLEDRDDTGVCHKNALHLSIFD